jgi:hypothetical protein
MDSPVENCFVLSKRDAFCRDKSSCCRNLFVLSKDDHAVEERPAYRTSNSYYPLAP